MVDVSFTRSAKMDNCEAQSDEILALASIYDPSVFAAEETVGIKGGQFVANLQLPQPFQIICKLPGDDKPAKIHQVEYLPPVTLNFQLPLDYPSSSPPHFTLSCKWLNREQLGVLCKRLDSVWEEQKGDVILFHWIQFLTDETLQCLGIGNTLDVSVYAVPISVCRQTNSRRPLQENVVNPEGNVTGNDDGGEKKDDMTVELGGTEQYDMEDSCSRTKGDHTRKPRRTRGPWKEQQSAVENKPGSKLKSRPFRRNSADHRLLGSPRNGAANELSAQGTTPRNNKAEVRAWDPRAIQELAPDALLLPVILDYDQQRRQQMFDSSVFCCNICFEEKLGSQCLEFKTCNHVFCRSCVQAYFEVQINSGNVQRLNCPEEKCSSQALPTQVRDLVAPELFAKYDRMLLTSTLDTMADIVYCPRHSCQCAVLVEPDSTMANCPACFHAFCILCKMAYHGVVPCRIKSGDLRVLCDEYVNASEEDRRHMEKRYGRSQIQHLVHNVLSEEWVQTNSKRCPNCHTPIEKRDGCNKMTCFHCDCYFCWLCMNRLNKSDPYDHYNNPSSRCVNLLFEGTDANDSDGDEDYGEFLV